MAGRLLSKTMILLKTSHTLGCCTAAFFACALTQCSSNKTTSSPKVASVISSADKDAFAKENNLELKKFDLNRDEQPDVFKFYRLIKDPDNKEGVVEQLVRKEHDLNHDGRIDVTLLYNDDQIIQEEHVDLDFDGKVDEINFFDGGVLIRKEIDLNYDGKPDIQKFYRDKKIERIEADRNNDGRVDTWEYYEGGNLDRIGTDTTGDGQVDNWDTKKTAAPEASEGQATEAQGEASEAAETEDSVAKSKETEDNAVKAPETEGNTAEAAENSAETPADPPKAEN